MPQTSEIHVDVALTNVSLGYRNAGTVGELLCPVVGVAKQSDKYLVVDSLKELFRTQDDRRAPGSQAKEMEWALSRTAYVCDDHALEHSIPDENLVNQDSGIDEESDAVEALTDKILLNQEVNTESTVRAAFSDGVNGETLAGANQWSDFSASNPVDAIEIKKATVAGKIGILPNALVLPYEVFLKVRQHPKILEHVLSKTNVEPGPVSAQQLAGVFDVDQVLVPRMIKNTSKKGQTASLSFVWGKNAILAYVPPSPGKRIPALAYTFTWTQAPGSIGGFVVDRYRSDSRKSNIIRVQKYYAPQVIASGSMYMWKEAVA